MGITAFTSTELTLPVSGRWVFGVVTTDDDGVAVSGNPSIVVTLPAGSTTSPTFEQISTGWYRATYTVVSTGRYIARVTATDHGAIDFSAFVEATTAQTGMPTLADVGVYLDGSSFDFAEIQDALDAEAAAQRAVCHVGAVYPADLRQALLRRVQVNLDRRKQPQQGLDAEGGFRPGRDPEVRRLEGPHRKLVVG